MERLKAFLRRYGVAVLIIVLVGISASIIVQKIFPPTIPSYYLVGTGRIDGDIITLNTKYAGRLDRVDVQDGMALTEGQTVALLQSEEYQAKRLQILAQIEAKQKEIQAKMIELEMMKRTIPQQLIKSQANTHIRIHQRQELEHMMTLQEERLVQATKDAQRIATLYEGQLIEKHQLEVATLKVQAEQEQLATLKQKIQQANEGVKIADSDQDDAKSSLKKIEALLQAIEGMKASLKAAQGGLAEIDAILDTMTLRAPAKCVVIEKIANKGEVVAAGMPIATLLDPSTLYLKIFLDTKANGQVKVGDKGVIFIDAFPDEPIEAKVVRIEQRAEFTPKEVSVPSDRIQRVFAVHLKPLKSDLRLKLGLPAVGVVCTDPSQPLPSHLHDIEHQ